MWRTYPRWQKPYTNIQDVPEYKASFKTLYYAEANARNLYPEHRIAITSMPRTSKHRIYQLWIYP